MNGRDKFKSEFLKEYEKLDTAAQHVQGGLKEVLNIIKKGTNSKAIQDGDGIPLDEYIRSCRNACPEFSDEQIYLASVVSLLRDPEQEDSMQKAVDQIAKAIKDMGENKSSFAKTFEEVLRRNGAEMLGLAKRDNNYFPRSENNKKTNGETTVQKQNGSTNGKEEICSSNSYYFERGKITVYQVNSKPEDKPDKVPIEVHLDMNPKINSGVVLYERFNVEPKEVKVLRSFSKGACPEEEKIRIIKPYEQGVKESGKAYIKKPPEHVEEKGKPQAFNGRRGRAAPGGR